MHIYIYIHVYTHMSSLLVDHGLPGATEEDRGVRHLPRLIVVLIIVTCVLNQTES